MKPRSKSLENGDLPEFKQNGGRLELNLDATDQKHHQQQQQHQQRGSRASSIEEVEKKVPKPVIEAREDADKFVAETQPKPKVPVKRPLRRESSWRQVSCLCIET